MPQSEAVHALDQAAGYLEAALGQSSGLEEIPPQAVGRLLAAAVRAYSGQVQRSGAVVPFAADCVAPTATDVCLTVTAMLDAVSVEVFELAMWKTWSSVGIASDAPLVVPDNGA